METNRSHWTTKLLTNSMRFKTMIFQEDKGKGERYEGQKVDRREWMNNLFSTLYFLRHIKSWNNNNNKILKFRLD